MCIYTIYIYMVYYIHIYIYTACNPSDPGSIPRSGRSPGEEHGKPLQYSCLENSVDRGARWATAHGVTKSQTRLSNEHFIYTKAKSHHASAFTGSRAERTKTSQSWMRQGSHKYR